jgi:hypothetical protein
MRIKKKESDICWWCDLGRKQTCRHLFGRCRAWRRELLALKKKVEWLKGKRRGRGTRLNVVSLFQDKWLMEAIVTDGRGTETESKELAAGVDGDSGAGTGTDRSATRWRDRAQRET